MSSKFGFILVKPQLGENIGACARAMKNFGFSKLHIVEPKINFPNHKAKATSVGAYDIINKAKVFNNIEDAIESFNLVVSLSARRRDINKKHISLKEFQKLNSDQINEKIDQLRKDLFDLRFKQATRQLNETHKFKIIKKQVAQLLTLSKSQSASKTTSD